MDSSSLQPPGDFPNEWRRLAFDNFTTLKRGKDLTRDQFRSGNVPVAGSNGPIGFHDMANVKAPGATVGRSGSVGRVTYYSEDFWAHNTSLFVADFHGNDERFATYFLQSIRLNRFGSGVSVPTLDRNVFRTLPVVVPPLAEQRKIASVLGLVQLGIEHQERLIEKTIELKKTLLHQLFTQGIRGESQKQTGFGSIPKGWVIVKFDDFTTLQRGKDLTKSEFKAGNIPVAGSNGIIGYHDTACARGPGVTVGRSGSVGKVCYHASDFWAHNTSLYVRNFHGNDPLFAFYLLGHLRLDRFGSGASVPTLDRNQFKDLPIAIPDVVEQIEIAKVSKTVDSKLVHHRRKNATLGALFRTMLHQLMTAQIRVHDLDIERILSQAK